MFFLTLILAANAEEPTASAGEAVSRHDVAVAIVAKKQAAEEAAKRADEIDKREHEQQMELLQTCKVGATGYVFGSAIASKCDIAFASAEAIRNGQPIDFKARGASVAVSANHYNGFGYGGYQFAPGFYQNIAYSGQYNTYDPSAEMLRRLTLSVSGLQVETNNNSAIIDKLSE